MTNPIIQDVLDIVRENPDGLSEFEIHQALSQNDDYAALGSDGLMSLFKKHFLVMNALYQLQDTLLKVENEVLEISPLLVRILSKKDQQAIDIEIDSAIMAGNTLNAYYLDWNNYNNTTEANVKKLIDNFWQRFASVDEQTKALRTLKLKADATRHEITRSYRELAARHHPDRGGDTETFIQVRQAYELLR